MPRPRSSRAAGLFLVGRSPRGKIIAFQSCIGAGFSPGRGHGLLGPLMPADLESGGRSSGGASPAAPHSTRGTSDRVPPHVLSSRASRDENASTLWPPQSEPTRPIGTLPPISEYRSRPKK